MRKFLTSYLWIALLTSGFVIFIDHKIIPEQGTWNILELRTIDFRFLLKKQPEKNAAKNITLIVIDEKSYKNINQPLIFYHTYISEVIDYLVESGAKVIGLDIELPSISLEKKVSGGYESIYTRTLLKARKEGVDVVIGFSSSGSPPLQTYLATAGQENLATFTLTVDSDDFIRRQQLWFGDRVKRYDSFPYLLAKKFTGKPLSPPIQTILIDYSLSRDIPYYSFDDIHRLSRQDRDQKSLFKDKVVIIGTLFSFEDRHPTPLYYSHPRDKRSTAGVVIQATTLNTLLSGSFFYEPDYLLGGFYIFLVSMLAVFLCCNRRPLHAAVLCLSEVGILVLTSIYAFNYLYVIRIIPLLLTVLLSYGATTVFHYYTEERKRMKIRERFASYVPEKIVDQIVDMDIEKLTEGEQIEVVLFFSDIRDFTSYSEKNKKDPKKIVNFLNQYHKEMTEIILSNNGTVSQLVGDGIFAFFGAPVKLANPVFAALKSAVQVKEKIAELKLKWQEYDMDDLRIGIGIHVGDAIVGNIGSIKKMDYVAIGDNTNIASRIEGLTKDFGETILISGATYERVQDKVCARSLGLAKIKGHSEVAIFAVDGIKNSI